MIQIHKKYFEILEKRSGNLKRLNFKMNYAYHTMFVLIYKKYKVFLSSV